MFSKYRLVAAVAYCRNKVDQIGYYVRGRVSGRILIGLVIVTLAGTKLIDGTANPSQSAVLSDHGVVLGHLTGDHCETCSYHAKTARELFSLTNVLPGVLPSSGSSTPASASPMDSDPTCVEVPMVSKCPTWTSTYDGPAHGPDGVGEGLLNSRVMATSPDGLVLYVAGVTDGDPSSGVDYDCVVVAFDIATGSQLWSSRYQGPANYPEATPFALVVSPNGSCVFVTAGAYTSDGQQAEIATIAVAADSGEQLWTQTFGEGSFTGTTDLAISPDGTEIYLAGEIADAGEAITICYDTATGSQRWFARYSGATGERMAGWKIAANPDGKRVYSAVSKLGNGGVTIDVILLVYDGLSGTLLNETHHPTVGTPPGGMAVSANGRLIVIEEGNNETGPNTALTLAYDAAGNSLWSARFQQCQGLKCSSFPWYYDPIAVAPDGDRIFVTVLGVNDLYETGFATVAYDGVTGSQQWVSQYQGNLFDCFCGPVITVNPDGFEVYVSGFIHSTVPVSPGTGDVATLAYNTATGAQNWMGLYHPLTASVGADAITTTPDGQRLIIGGATEDLVSLGTDLLVYAYTPDVPPPVNLRRVVSRKTHGAAGTYDLDLPLIGDPAIECRSGDAIGNYTLVFTFANPLMSVGSATVSTGTGTISDSMIEPADSHNYIVNLTGVTNAQTIRVSLTTVIDAAGNQSSSVSATMGVLIGDVNASGVVDSGDMFVVRQHTGESASSANYREDVNASGLIDSGDVFITRQDTATSLLQSP